MQRQSGIYISPCSVTLRIAENLWTYRHLYLFGVADWFTRNVQYFKKRIFAKLKRMINIVKLHM